MYYFCIAVQAFGELQKRLKVKPKFNKKGMLNGNPFFYLQKSDNQTINE